MGPEARTDSILRRAPSGPNQTTRESRVHVKMIILPRKLLTLAVQVKTEVHAYNKSACKLTVSLNLSLNFEREVCARVGPGG